MSVPQFVQDAMQGQRGWNSVVLKDPPSSTPDDPTNGTPGFILDALSGRIQWDQIDIEGWDNLSTNSFACF